MFAKTKEVELEDKKVTCKDLTYGFIVGLTNGALKESAEAVIENGTDLTLDEVMALRNWEVEALYLAVSQLTYPQYYNEDGSMKKLPDDGETDATKKKQ
jgi:hypothetical protein